MSQLERYFSAGNNVERKRERERSAIAKLKEKKKLKSRSPVIGKVLEREYRITKRIHDGYFAGVSDREGRKRVKTAYEYIYKKYENRTEHEIENCRIPQTKKRTGETSDAITCVNFRVRDPDTDISSVHLTQVASWLNSDKNFDNFYSIDVDDNGERKKLVCSHRCHISTCIVCPIPESAAENNSRSHCVILRVDCDEVVSNCTHVPKCLRSGKQNGNLFIDDYDDKEWY